MAKPQVTRGYGLLEGFLAEQRSKAADRLIPPPRRQGRILDIGCGTYPLFLLNTDFSEKYGLDKVVPDDDIERFQHRGIALINCDIETSLLPFDGEYFDVVTMLAVVEHIESKRLVQLLREIHRTLRPGGVCIMTTPAFWTHGLLRLMAKLRLVSPVEVAEHKYTYAPSQILSMLQEADFAKERLRLGHFETFMNVWATATK